MQLVTSDPTTRPQEKTDIFVTLTSNFFTKSIESYKLFKSQ